MGVLFAGIYYGSKFSFGSAPCNVSQDRKAKSTRSTTSAESNNHDTEGVSSVKTLLWTTPVIVVTACVYFYWDKLKSLFGYSTGLEDDAVPMTNWLPIAGGAVVTSLVGGGLIYKWWEDRKARKELETKKKQDETNLLSAVGRLVVMMEILNPASVP